ETITRHAHQNVAQKRGLRGGSAKISTGNRCLHRGQLALHLRGPARRLGADLCDSGPYSGGVTLFCSDAAQLEQSGEIIWLHREDLLHELLKLSFAVGRSL